MKLKNPILSFEEIIKIFEKYLNLNFSNDYKNFLIIMNGGKAHSNFFSFGDPINRSSVRYFFGLTNQANMNILNELKVYSNRYPSNTFPIADDPGGNLILLFIKGPDRGKVYFWDHEFEAAERETPDYSNLTLIADSFDEFLANLKDDPS